MSWSPPAPISVPIMPASLGDTKIFQVHASRYANPGQLPPGAVLVVGSGASGAQIAEELFRAGRRVYLSVGRHTRLPRRYRGRDLVWWLSALGLDQTTVEQRGPSRLLPVISGAYGGHTIDFRRFADEGVTLLGRVEAARDGVIDFAADLAESLAGGDATYAAFLDMADAHVKRHAPDMPEDPAARAVLPDPRCVTEPLRQLDIGADGIGAVIWATGYGVDFGWIDIDVFNAQRRADPPPRHRRGSGTVFPRPAMALQDELVVSLRRRRRRRRARGPHRRAHVIPFGVSSRAFALLSRPDSPHIQAMAKNPDPPKKPVKTPKSKAPKSKAHRPDVQPIGPALAELLNPAINRGEAGMGSGTGLQPPPDNSWDRRSGGEAAAHRARASTRGTEG